MERRFLVALWVTLSWFCSWAMDLLKVCGLNSLMYCNLDCRMNSYTVMGGFNFVSDFMGRVVLAASCLGASSRVCPMTDHG